ncbi:MAG: protein kinase [Actinomycetota bacterium]|nr:protein kinase [Actinomycetota bacterium]
MKVPRVGDEFAGYRIEAVLGRGGMGIVYRAEHIGLERKVALKLLSESLSEDDAFRRRFIRESKLAASMDHPNIIPIYEAGEHEGLLYISMRYVDGSDLKQIIRTQGFLDAAISLLLLEQVGSALDSAHARGLVHRDVKPHNMLIATPAGLASDHVYLSDFGLAKHVSSRTEVTATGTFMGTIDYVAPEQIEGKEIDKRIDIYSLGCVLFECLTGTVPFQGDTDVAIAHGHVAELPPSICEVRRDLPSGLDKVLSTALAKNPGDRYQSGGELISAARTVLEAAGHELHALVGSGGREEHGANPHPTLVPPGPGRGVTAPPAGTPGGSSQPRGFGTPIPAVAEGPSDAVTDPFAAWRPPPPPGAQPAVEGRSRRRLFLAAIVLLVGIGAGLTFFLRNGGEPDEPVARFIPRATSEFPAALPEDVGEFQLQATFPERVRALEGFTGKKGGYYKDRSDNQVFHSIIAYEQEDAAEDQRRSQIAFLIGRGFRVQPPGEQELKRALGGRVGSVTLLQREEGGKSEEAIVWRNEALVGSARGPVGATLDFFSELAY